MVHQSHFRFDEMRRHSGRKLRTRNPPERGTTTYRGVSWHAVPREQGVDLGDEWTMLRDEAAHVQMQNQATTGILFFFFFLRSTILFGHFCVYTTPHVYAFLMKPGVQSTWISLHMCERHISGQTETYLVGTPTWVWIFCANMKSTGTFPKKTVEIHGGIS